MEQLGVVDTSVIISYLRGNNPGASCLRSLIKQDRVILSTISAFELRLGETDEQNPSLENLFDVVKISNLDVSVATKAAGIFKRLEAQGNRIGLRDTFIGATAMDEGVPVYTQNVEHFNRIPDLKVITPDRV